MIRDAVIKHASEPNHDPAVALMIPEVAYGQYVNHAG